MLLIDPDGLLMILAHFSFRRLDVGKSFSHSKCSIQLLEHFAPEWLPGQRGHRHLPLHLAAVPKPLRGGGGKLSERTPPPRWRSSRLGAGGVFITELETLLRLEKAEAATLSLLVIQTVSS